jgi:PAS domain S-box-containing protein
LQIAKDAAALGIHDWDIVTGEIEWDTRVRDLWGVAPEDPVDFGVFRAGLHPDDREPTQQAIDRALDPAGDGKYMAEYRVIHRSDGQTRWIVATGRVFFEAGRAVRLVGTVQDITDRKRAEEAIRERESELRQIADSMPQMVWVSNVEGRDEYHNRRWYDYTGLTPPSPDWSRIIHPDDLARTAELWRHSLATGDPYEIEYRLKRHDGQFRWFLGRAEPIRDSDGAIVRWFGTCTDIHDQRMTADDLRRANQDLQQFAYAASHDLQEPLRAVTSYTQLLSRRYGAALDDDGQKYIKFALEGAARLQSLLQDLRTFWATGVQSSEPEVAVDTRALLDEVTANLGHQLRRSGAEVRIDASLPIVQGHRTMFVQLFQNLVSNAIKYRSPDRSAYIEISAELKGGEWVFHVADNGIGIDPKHFPKLFRVFSRLHGGNYEGTGLGLAICQRIVERMDGRIWLESEPDKGSKFSFAVPVPAVDIQSARG